MIFANSVNSKRKKSVQFQRNGYQGLIHPAPLFSYEKSKCLYCYCLGIELDETGCSIKQFSMKIVNIVEKILGRKGFGIL